MPKPQEVRELAKKLSSEFRGSIILAQPVAMVRVFVRDGTSEETIAAIREAAEPVHVEIEHEDQVPCCS